MDETVKVVNQFKLTHRKNRWTLNIGYIVWAISRGETGLLHTPLELKAAGYQRTRGSWKKVKKRKVLYNVNITYYADKIDEGVHIARVSKSIKARIETLPAYLEKEILERAMVDARQISTEKLVYEFLLVDPKKTQVFHLDRGIPLDKVKMKGVALPYKMLNTDDIAKLQPNQGECVIDYLVWICCNNPKLPTYTRGQLKKSFPEWESGVDTQEIIQWCSKHRISVTALDGFKRVYSQLTVDRKQVVESITFMNNNQHLYPIVDPEWKRAAKTGRWSPAGPHQTTDAIYVKDYDLGSDYNRAVHVDTHDLSEICYDVVNLRKVLPDAISSKDGTITQLQFGQETIYASKDHNDRMSICDKLFDLTNINSFKWKNQSYVTISLLILEKILGITLPSSPYDPDLFDDCAPYVDDLVNELPAGAMAYDWSKQFSTLLRDSDDPWILHSHLDIIEPYDGKDIEIGSYYINRNWELNDAMNKIGAGWRTYGLVRHALAAGVITKDDITYQKVCTNKVLSHDFFKPFVNYVIEHLGLKRCKSLINSFIGNLGRMYDHNEKCAISCDDDTVRALFWAEQDRGNECNITSLSPNLHIIRSKESNPLPRNNRPIWSQVVEKSWITVDRLIKLCYPQRILSIKVDSVGVAGRVDNPEINRLLAKGSDLGGLKEEVLTLRNVHRPVPEKPPKYSSPVTDLDRAWTSITKAEALQVQALACVGEPGTRKTWLLLELMKEDPEAIALAFTNQASYVIRSRGEPRATTLSSFFDKPSWRSDVVNGGIQRICIDEGSMTPLRYIECLIEVRKIAPWIKIAIFLDEWQCEQVETHKDKQYRYLESYSFKKLFDWNLLSLPYDPTTARYTPETRRVLQHIKDHGQLPPDLKDRKLWENCTTNIVKTNKMKHKINSMNKGTLRLGTFSYKVGDHLRCLKNLKKLEEPIYNGGTCVITKLSPQLMTLEWHGGHSDVFPTNLLRLSDKDMRATFELKNAQTVHCYQGATLWDKFNVHELEKMTIQELITAISRTTDIDNVGFEYTDKVFIRKPFERKPNIVYNTDCQECEEGFIYGIHHKGELMYIGSTYDCERRFQEHMKSTDGDRFHTYIRQHDEDDFELTILSELGYCTRWQMVAEEARTIRQAIGAGKELYNTITYNASPEIILQGQRLKTKEGNLNKFTISDDEKRSRLRMKYEDPDLEVVVDKRIRYGKNKTKEQAMNEMLSLRRELYYEKYNVFI